MRTSTKTFDADVTLGIKEALTLRDMVKYGLTTMADGKPLQTDGMFHIDAKDASGKQPKINIPLEINLPANNMLDDPKLFTGKQDENGFINWEKPTNINNQKTFKDIDIGENIFNTRCAACHRIDFDRPQSQPTSPVRDSAVEVSDDGHRHHSLPDSTSTKTYSHSGVGSLVGPSLLYINKRRSYDWFKSFTNNPEQMLKSGDGCALCIYESYKDRGVMPPQGLSDIEMEALWKYIIKQSNKSTIDSTDIAFLDCHVTTTTIDYNIKKSNSKFDWNKPYVPDSTWPVITKQDFENKLTETQQYVYSIKIDTFGWYNIDQYATPDENGMETELDITVLNADKFTTLSVVLVYEESFTTVLLKPSGNGKFGFGDKTYLPEEAISLYVLGEQNDKLFYYLNYANTKKSTDGKKLTVSCIADLKPTTRDEVENLLDKNYKTKPVVTTNINPCGGVLADTIKIENNY